jgi:hypothetical protein
VDIGEEQEKITVEPLEDPVPGQKPVADPAPVESPEQEPDGEPEEVPA